MRTVWVHLAPLLSPQLTSCTKLVAIGLDFLRDPYTKKLKEGPSPTRLRRLLGPSRTTILKALAALNRPWRYEVPADLESLPKMSVKIPEALIADRTLPPLARVVYCVLVGLSQLNRHDILSSFAAIAAVLKLQRRTVRQAMLALERAGWLGIKQKSKYAPIRFSFPNPQVASRKAEVRRAKQFLQTHAHQGEALARLWCDALVDSAHYKDNFYPKFLINPDTNELLQADRYYLKHNAIIEFQGPQHDGATELFSEEEAREQMERDRIKRQICARHKIPLIELRPEDLTYARLRELLGRFLPLRDRSPKEPIIRFLEKRSRRYRKYMEGVRKRAGQGRRGARRPPTDDAANVKRPKPVGRAGSPQPLPRPSLEKTNVQAGLAHHPLRFGEMAAHCVDGMSVRAGDDPLSAQSRPPG